MLVSARGPIQEFLTEECTNSSVDGLIRHLNENDTMYDALYDLNPETLKEVASRVFSATRISYFAERRYFILFLKKFPFKRLHEVDKEDLAYKCFNRFPIHFFDSWEFAHDEVLDNIREKRHKWSYTICEELPADDVMMKMTHLELCELVYRRFSKHDCDFRLCENFHLPILRTLLHSEEATRQDVVHVLRRACHIYRECVVERGSLRLFHKLLPKKWSQRWGKRDYKDDTAIVEIVHGGGYFHIRDFLEGRSEGYFIDDGRVGIYVDPAKMDREKFYAIRTPIRHFDLPAKLTAKIEVQHLHTTNRSYEAALHPSKVKHLKDVKIERFPLSIKEYMNSSWFIYEENLEELTQKLYGDVPKSRQRIQEVLKPFFDEHELQQALLRRSRQKRCQPKPQYSLKSALPWIAFCVIIIASSIFAHKYLTEEAF